MIRKKTKEEIKILREGGKILANIIKELGEMVRPGVDTKKINDRAIELILEAKGRPAFKDLPMADGRKFPTAICASIDNQVVHAPALPTRVLKNGQIIKIDIGMEFPLIKNKKSKVIYNKHSNLGGFYTDMAKTFLVGNVSPEAKKLVAVTRECLNLAIKQVKPQNDLNDIGRAIQKHAEKNGFSVVREMVGHGVGHEVHEDPQIPHYEVRDGSMRIVSLKPGMVIAIEPMINTGEWMIKASDDGFAWETVDGGLSAQFEHTIAITENGCEVLTRL